MVYSVVSYTVEVNGAFDVVGAVVVVVVGFEVDVLVDEVLDADEVEEEEELEVGVEVGSSKQEQAELTLSGLSLQFSR
jgi:hypothetical protein